MKITEAVHNALVNHFEFKGTTERIPDFYPRLKELMKFEALELREPEEIKRRVRVWSEYYAKVKEISPAAHLYQAWRDWYQGKGEFTKEQLLAMTEDMKKRGLRNIEGKPEYADPYELWNLITQAQARGMALLKKAEKKPARTWE